MKILNSENIYFFFTYLPKHWQLPGWLRGWVTAERLLENIPLFCVIFSLEATLTKTGFLSCSQELPRYTVSSAPINLTGSKRKDVQVLLCRFENWQKQTQQKKTGKLCKKSKCCTLDWRRERLGRCWNEGRLAEYAAPYSITPEEWITRRHHISILRGYLCR